MMMHGLANPKLRVHVCILAIVIWNITAHAPYCHLQPVRLNSIIPHYFINGTILGEKNY
jgi:hypothetical protein